MQKAHQVNTELNAYLKPPHCATKENIQDNVNGLYTWLYISAWVREVRFFFSSFTLPHNLGYCLCYLGEECWKTRFTRQTDRQACRCRPCLCRQHSAYQSADSCLHERLWQVQLSFGVRSSVFSPELETGEGWRLSCCYWQCSAV